MAAVTAIMDELAAVLDDVLGAGVLGDDAFTIVGRLNLDPAVPAIDIYPAPEFVTADSRGFGDPDGTLQFVVRARVDGDAYGRQDLLLSLMDAEHDNCVASALEADQTLNGLASSVAVDGPSGYTIYADMGGARSHIGAEWRVSVLRVLS